MSLSAALRQTIHQRKRARFEREARQSDLIAAADVHKASIAAKLIGLASGSQFDNFQRCGVEELYCTCAQCGNAETFFYNCNRKFCPRCQPRIARARRESLKAWAERVNQPKHLVLTMRNFPVLTKPKIRQFQKALLQLRKRKIWSNVKGGCATIEITNEGRGWHLHAHLLIDCRFLDIKQCAIEWGHLVRQEYGIVRIADVRNKSYLAECAKYVAKGSEIAAWPAEQIWEFVLAIKGCRFFFAFGSLFKMGGEIRRALNQARGGGKVCKCGCSRFDIDTEYTAVMKEIRNSKRRR
jgi:Replication protein